MSLSTKRRGPWSSVEDQRLMNYIRADPTLNWVNIAMQVESRTPKQCRERYHQNLKNSLNHSPITAAEGAIINAYVQRHGKRWADIARQLDGRSDNAVKNWWNGNQNRLKRAEQRRRAATESAATPSTALAPAVSHAHAHLNQLYNRTPPPPPSHHRHHHHRNSSGSIQDLVDAAEMQSRLRESYRQTTYEQSYPSVSLPPPRQYHESYVAQGPSLPREILREAQPQQYHQYHQESPREPLQHYQPQPQHQSQARPSVPQLAPYAQYAPAEAGPSSSSFDPPSRRPSMYAASPGAESDVPPSLVSDHGSPSERGSALQAWPSPDVELPPLLNINGSISKDRAHASFESSPLTQYALPGPASRRVSLAGESAYAPSYRHHSLQPEERDLPRTEQPTPAGEEVEDAARTIMNLPKSNDKSDRQKRGHLDLHDLLN